MKLDYYNELIAIHQRGLSIVILNLKSLNHYFKYNLLILVWYVHKIKCAQIYLSMSIFILNHFDLRINKLLSNRNEVIFSFWFVPAAAWHAIIYFFNNSWSWKTVFYVSPISSTNCIEIWFFKQNLPWLHSWNFASVVSTNTLPVWKVEFKQLTLQMWWVVQLLFL